MLTLAGGVLLSLAPFKVFSSALSTFEKLKSETRSAGERMKSKTIPTIDDKDVNEFKDALRAEKPMTIWGLLFLSVGVGCQIAGGVISGLAIVAS